MVRHVTEDMILQAVVSHRRERLYAEPPLCSVFLCMLISAQQRVINNNTVIRKCEINLRDI